MDDEIEVVYERDGSVGLRSRVIPNERHFHVSEAGRQTKDVGVRFAVADVANEKA